jgi:hypothetical protein
MVAKGTQRFNSLRPLRLNFAPSSVDLFRTGNSYSL